MAAASHLLFSMVFLSLRGWLRRIFQSFVVLYIALLLLSFAFNYTLMLKASLLASMITCVVSLSVGIHQWLVGNAAARIYTISWSAFIVGGFVSSSVRFELVPYSLWTEFAGVFGSMATIILLSMAIADRINSEKQRRIGAQNEAIATLGKYESLYQNSAEGIFVASTTGELENANPAFLSMLGLSSFADLEKTSARSLAKLFKIPREYQQLVEKLRSRRVLIDEEVEWLRPDGGSFWASLSLRASSQSDCGALSFDGMVMDISERKAAASRLAFLASHDPLTNLFNRREFELHLNMALENISKDGSTFCVLYLDLDQFKVVNDSCGHRAGDKLLCELTRLMEDIIQGRGVLARLGGDEFAILVPGASSVDAYQLAESLRKAVNEFRYVYQERIFNLGVSIGLVEVTGLDNSSEDIMSLADTACYVAKEAGRDRVHVYSSSSTAVDSQRTQIAMVSEINAALESDRFCLYRQRIVAADPNSALNFAEILLRLEREDGDIVEPNTFLPVAARYNLMPRVDRWVIAHCFAWLAENPNELDSIHHCAINLSGDSLNDDRFVGFVLGEFSKYQIPFDKICFEITEYTAIQNITNTRNVIDAFRERGCKFSLDDFGTGFSSYGYLKNLPADYLKIDGAFILNIADDPVDFAMVKSIRDVAQAMGMETVAEFVECERVIAKLQEIGVDYLQGYAIDRPHPI